MGSGHAYFTRSQIWTGIGSSGLKILQRNAAKSWVDLVSGAVDFHGLATRRSFAAPEFVTQGQLRPLCNPNNSEA